MSVRTLRSMSSAVDTLVRGTPLPGSPARRPRVAVITDEASMGAEALAALAGTAATRPDLRQQTEMRIRHCADPAASVREFVDLTRGCSPDSLTAAVDALADDPGCDAVLVALAADDPDHSTTLIRAVERFRRDHPGTAVTVVRPPGPPRGGRRAAPPPWADRRAGLVTGRTDRAPGVR